MRWVGAESEEQRGTPLEALSGGERGRLHLAKNVYATKAQLRTMYAHAIDELTRLKARVDPRNVLVNDFFARAFG